MGNAVFGLLIVFENTFAASLPTLTLISAKREMTKNPYPTLTIIDNIGVYTNSDKLFSNSYRSSQIDISSVLLSCTTLLRS